MFDGDRGQLVAAYRAMLRAKPMGEPRLVFGAHINALLARRDKVFVDAMRRADLTYADGNSVALLARLGGATQIRRAVTTDVGWDLLAATAEQLDRPVRLACLGGPEGLADQAATTFAKRRDIHPVFTAHGYQDDWEPVLHALRASKPDVCVVGLGMPRENIWAAAQVHRMGPTVVLTAGGWFGYLAGNERRAPLWVRRFGFEWLFRLLQDPRRLAGRYLKGMGAVISVGVRQGLSRRKATADMPSQTGSPGHGNVADRQD